MFDAINIGGLRLFGMTSSGRRDLASYHPRSSLTWHWIFTVDRQATGSRWGFYTIPLGDSAKQRMLRLGMWTVMIQTQSYHKDSRS